MRHPKGWQLVDSTVRPAGGGLADVYLDGELVKTVDTYPDEDDVKFNEAVWHAFGLGDGEHEVRLVVRGEPFSESQGTEICLTELVVFR